MRCKKGKGAYCILPVRFRGILTEFQKRSIHARSGLRNNVRMLVSLTSFLHEAEQFVEELLPLGVVVDLVELKEKRRWCSILSFEGGSCLIKF